MSKSLVEKYRPKSLDELIGNNEIVEILKSFSRIPNLLFYGPLGTGKTSAIKILSLGYQTLELNASDDRGIEIVRNEIKEFSSAVGNRLVILDEVDSMSRDAQNALRRIIEDSNTRFCLIGNYINKIIPPIQSRCTKFRFSPISNTEIKRRADYICEMENIKVVSGLEKLIEISNGDMRTFLNDLEGVWRGFGNITIENIYKFTGMVSFDFDLNLINENLDRIKGIVDGTTLCHELGEKIRNSEIEDKLFKLKKLAEIEYNLSLGCSEDLQYRGIKNIFQ